MLTSDARARHSHGLLDAADFQLIGGSDTVSPTVTTMSARETGRNPDELGAQLVLARRNAGDHEAAVGGGDCAAGEAGRPLPQRELHAGQQRSGSVDD